jgi:hypothetical protein
MNHVLPPLDEPARLVIELRFVPAPDRDDAVQEAWLAHLEGRPVSTAVNTYAQSGYVPIVTAGFETRTLAIPTFVGQELLLFIKTDGGTCVITVASAINQTGNNTITMAEVNDSIRLHAIDNNGTLAWRVVCNDGAALSTV